jgi:hypothetical protein
MFAPWGHGPSELSMAFRQHRFSLDQHSHTDMVDSEIFFGRQARWHEIIGVAIRRCKSVIIIHQNCS